MMRSRTMLLVMVVVGVVATAPSPGKSSGNSQASVIFSDSRRNLPPQPWEKLYGTGGRQPAGSRIQFGETSATSVQTSSPGGGGTNTGQASGVSVQQQSGLGGATQVTNNQALIQAAQEAGASGRGGSEQTSNNQVNINSQQIQQNVNGTLVNVQTGSQGVVVINTNDPSGAVVNQKVVNNRPRGKTSAESSGCRFVCLRSDTGVPYCCDDGTNNRGDPTEIHGGMCPAVRLLCTRNDFRLPPKCAHDGQCAPSDKCCYDTCLQHHVCKTAD